MTQFVEKKKAKCLRNRMVFRILTEQDRSHRAENSGGLKTTEPKVDIRGGAPNIRTPCAWKTSFPISGRRMRTTRPGTGAPERVAKHYFPHQQERHPCGCRSVDSDVSDVKTIRRSVFTIGVPQSKEYGAGGYAARYGRLCDGDRMPASGGYHRLSPDGEGRRSL